MDKVFFTYLFFFGTLYDSLSLTIRILMNYSLYKIFLLKLPGISPI